VRCGLGDEADDGGFRVAQGQHLPILSRSYAGPPGGAEGNQLGIPQRQLGAGTGEELGVLGHGTGPAALDETHPDLVEQPGDGELVVDRVADPLALRAVSQGRVEYVERIAE
jgi:hypothetical protein